MAASGTIRALTSASWVGAKVLESGGKTMRRLLMELGGKGAADEAPHVGVT